MKKIDRSSCLRLSVLALAVLATLGTARAEGSSDLQSFVTVGGAGVSGEAKDRALFCQYNGLCDNSFYGLLDFGYSRLDSATGTWAEAFGTNLLLDTRELGFSWRRQGNWAVNLNYSELVRRDPYTVNTGMAGAGSTSPQLVYLSGGPGSGFTSIWRPSARPSAAGFRSG